MLELIKLMIRFSYLSNQAEKVYLMEVRTNAVLPKSDPENPEMLAKIYNISKRKERLTAQENKVQNLIKQVFM